MTYLLSMFPQIHLGLIIPLLFFGLIASALGPEGAAQRYAIRILIAIDQVGTTLVGGFPDETMSSYAYRMDQKGRFWGRVWRPIIDFLFSWKDYPHGHCEDAYQGALQRVGLPPELR